MYRVLMAKLVEFDLSFSDLSEAIGMSVKVLKQCINGEREFRLTECVKIRNFINSKLPEDARMTLDDLFKPKTDGKL